MISIEIAKVSKDKDQSTKKPPQIIQLPKSKKRIV